MYIIQPNKNNLILIFFLFFCTFICSLGCTQKDISSSPTTTISQQNDSIVTCLEKQYQYARSLRVSQTYTESIEAYKACLRFDSDKETVQLALEPIIVDAMTELLKSYQSEGNPDACIEYFDSLTKAPPPLIQKYCMRDVYSFLGYALSRTDRIKEAERMTLKALDMPQLNATPQRLFLQYTLAAAVFYSNLDMQDEAINWCHIAIEQANLSKTPTNIQWLTTLLGSLYKRTGKINEAIDLLLQSVQDARKLEDIHGEANAYNTLANLFLYWGLPQYANKYATLAVQNVSQKKERPMFTGVIYATKAKVMQHMNYSDSTFLFLEKADSCCKNLSYNSGLADIDYLWGTFMINQNYSADSIAKGIEKLKHVTTFATPILRAKAYHQLSRAYLNLQQKQNAEIMLDSMYLLLNQSSSPIYLEKAYTDALTYYVDNQNSQKINQYAKALLNEMNFRLDKQTAKKLAETVVKFQTEKKEQELLLAHVELENKKLHIRLYFLSSLCIIVLIIAILFYNKKMHLMQQQLMEQRLSTMLNNLESANQQTVQIEQQLSDILTEKDSRKEIEAVTPGLLKEKGEPKFRQRFEQLYPRFLPALKERIPNIGRKEELLSMLIVLGQDNKQIAVLMGIAHSSVNMARYRLRQKLGLDKDVNLDDVIKNML